MKKKKISQVGRSPIRSVIFSSCIFRGPRTVHDSNLLAIFCSQLAYLCDCDRENSMKDTDICEELPIGEHVSIQIYCYIVYLTVYAIHKIVLSPKYWH